MPLTSKNNLIVSLLLLLIVISKGSGGFNIFKSSKEKEKFHLSEFFISSKDFMFAYFLVKYFTFISYKDLLYLNSWACSIEKGE